MQMVLSATLSRLYCILEDIHMSTDTLVQVFTSFLISTLVPLAPNLPTKSHLRSG